MTKQEFDRKLSKAYTDVINSIDLHDVVRTEIYKNADEDNKISNTMLAVSVLNLSITLNQKMLRSILSEFFEIDE